MTTQVPMEARAPLGISTRHGPALMLSLRGDVMPRPEPAPGAGGRPARLVSTRSGGSLAGQPSSSSGQKESPLRLPAQLEAADAPGSQAWWLNVWPAWPDSGQSTGRHPHGSQLGLPAARRTFRRL